MKILGIDPGLVQTGYGIITINNNNPQIVDYGVVKPTVNDGLASRLLTIFEDVSEIISIHKPSIFSIEDVFYGKNAKSALRLGQARGAAMVAAASAGLSIHEYSARKIKQAVTGNGNAHKEQVQFMVKATLKMDKLPKPIDASDALATALCHFQQFRLAEL
ncbi:MAG: crossover junction endodeoxyribonuclease RuvC [Candidatus Marinimicrobia bacterium]|nr:crossover junction endodeoxyribonuclease RuvC [Candidatus Neomarinimicrobiota bacterium]MBT5956163.1 crossover junction endodeoxyribonuclease RuvC [Candidatus Neomarinimicrobiota bacterium]MBT6870378.1 crossover junction endodeoxyribonuclease RuvC [Candidatus Neomarinimicrobiota bacterium]MBT7377384.1 crossover junction endodeoxyribonuclease RuvC [Candidatus Neomarinimicrobiota bacterium]